MANNCFYAMKIVGKKENCDRWVELMENYDLENHFWHMFNVDVYEEETTTDGDTVMYLNGDCAFSIESCCRASGYSEGVDLLAVNSKALNLIVEIWTEEYGIGFQEHYVYKNGECLVDACEEAQEWFWNGDEYPTYEDFKNVHPDAPDEDEFDGPDSWGPVKGGFKNYCEWTT